MRSLGLEPESSILGLRNGAVAPASPSRFARAIRRSLRDSPLTGRSHDWHVQPVVKDRIADRLSGAFRSSVKRQSASRPRILRLRPPYRAAICRKPFKHTANCCCWSTHSSNFLQPAVANLDYSRETRQAASLQQFADQRASARGETPDGAQPHLRAVRRRIPSLGKSFKEHLLS